MAGFYQKVLAADSTNNTAPVFLETATKPATSVTVGIIEPISASISGLDQSRSFLEFQPYGTNSDADTIDIWVAGWTRNANDPTGAIWVPRVLAAVTVTLSDTLVGVAGGIGTNHYYADTIAAISGFPAPLRNGSNGANQPCSFIVDPAGCELVSVVFDLNTGSAAANALWRQAAYLGVGQ